MRPLKRLALLYGAPAGVGGLGVQVANAIQGLAIEGVELHAFGPGHAEQWPLPGAPPKISWHDAPSGVSQFRARCTPLRWRQGQLVFENCLAIGSWAADQIARTIANSPLVKTAIHGGDPNWGRLIAAAGRAGVAFDLSRATVTIGPTVLFEDGRPYDEAAPRAAEYLRRTEIDVSVGLGAGSATSTVWTCDLSAEYVRINADYRT